MLMRNKVHNYCACCNPRTGRVNSVPSRDSVSLHKYIKGLPYPEFHSYWVTSDTSTQVDLPNVTPVPGPPDMVLAFEFVSLSEVSQSNASLS